MPKTKKKNREMLWLKPNFGIPVPRTGSYSSIQYFTSFRQITSFMQYVLRMASSIEKMAETAHKTLLEVEEDALKRQEMEKNWASRKGPIEELKKHRQFYMETMLVRLVENYLNYLSSILKEIFISRPEVLRSSEKIDLEVVLRHESIEDLVKTVAERKVDNLTYSSFSDLATYFTEKFHITLFSAEDTKLVIKSIETRNISVHNRCIINHRYVSRTGESAGDIGKIKELWVQDIENISRIFADSVRTVDREARTKLKIAGRRYPKESTI